MQKQYISVAVPRPLDQKFTYRLPEGFVGEPHVGSWVKVPFGRSTTHAYVVGGLTESLPANVSPRSIKAILEVGAETLPRDVYDLCLWAHEYYRVPLGEILNCAAPAAALGLRNKKPPRGVGAGVPVVEESFVVLTEEQKNAIQVVTESSKTTTLVHGVTGSGKTEVYIALARKYLSEGKGVILLVPEIALTPQLHDRFEAGLGVRVALWHSALPDGQRRDLWAALKRGDLKVVVGARSAVFAPVKDLGLIVVDEEHDSSYKQEDRVKYHARDLAIVRATQNKAKVVLGSATPSLETLERVTQGRYDRVILSQRAVGGATLPPIELVDLVEEEKVENTQAPLAKRTVEAIQETVSAGEQCMIFLNRRGFAAFQVCDDCGEVKGCPNCSISLTVHRRSNRLKCHVCGHQELMGDLCWACNGSNLRLVGAGTESLEEELPQLIEGLIPLRLDRDKITSATRLGATLESFRRGEANCLMGTQMLVKGHDFPGVTLVVVILADALFRWPDFRAPERALQILQQVSGRAGRGEKPGRVLIQTYSEDHPVLKVLTGQESLDEFLASERELRQDLHYPPFGRLARFRFESSDQKAASSAAHQTAQALTGVSQEQEFQVLGPSEAFLERVKGIYRWDILIKASSITGVHRAVVQARSLPKSVSGILSVDIDPMSMG